MSKKWITSNLNAVFETKSINNLNDWTEKKEQTTNERLKKTYTHKHECGHKANIKNEKNNKNETQDAHGCSMVLSLNGIKS